MRKLLLFLALALFSHETLAAYGFVGSVKVATAGQTSEQTGSYSPTSTNSLILVIKTRVNALPLLGYTGSGTPGDGVNSYSFLGYDFGTSGNPTFSLSGSASSGATSANLASSWAGTTGTYTAIFSDGEYRKNVTLTNGSTGFSWATGLAANCSATVQIAGNPNMLAFYQATNVSNTSVQAGVSSASAQIDGVELQEYSGIAAASPGTIGGTSANPSDVAWNFQSNPGAGVNILVSGTTSISSAVMLWGITYDWSCNATPIAGTSPIAFTSRTGIDTCSVAEDANASTTAQTTFGPGSQFDSFTTVAIAFPLGGGGGGGGVGITGVFNQFPFAQWQVLTSNTTLSPAQPKVLCNATAGSFTITLPTAVNAFTDYEVKKSDSSANTCTIATTSSQTIDGATTQVISTQYAHDAIRSDNANWWIQ